MSIHIGTAGYVYPHWRKGAFYPPGLSQVRELPHYLSNFPCVEINATWHAFPRLTTLQKWRTCAHPQTRFALKAPALITHEKRLLNVEQPIHAFIRLAKEGLAHHLGPILFQCPPSLPLSLSLLHQFLATIRAAVHQYGPVRVALEFRSPDWFCPPVYALLAEHDIALVNNVAVKDTDFAVLEHLFPHARHVDHPAATWRYNRFHGSKNPGVFTDFPDHILRPFAEQQGVQYSFFLNDWAAIAPKNAIRYARLCAHAKGVPVKNLFDGFVPEWSRVRPSIKSFFAPASNTAPNTAPNTVPKNAPNKNGRAPDNEAERSRNDVQHQSTASPKSMRKPSPSSTVKSPVKLLKPAIKKKRTKPASKDIASYFSSSSDKG